MKTTVLVLSQLSGQKVIRACSPLLSSPTNLAQFSQNPPLIATETKPVGICVVWYSLEWNSIFFTCEESRTYLVITMCEKCEVHK